jgi:hypothetical protein
MKTQLRNHVAALVLLAPVAAVFTALPSAALAQPATPQVRGLEVTSDNGIHPGSRLRFTLRGSPHAQASIHIRGVQGRIPLREVERGVYTGRYVIARGDRIEEGSRIRALLRHGNREVAVNYSIPEGLGNVAAASPRSRGDRDRGNVASADNRPPVITNMAPREGDRVRGGPATVVSGEFRDPGGSGIDPDSVRILLSGRNVTRHAQITPEAFVYRGPLPPGPQTVDITARDHAGNTVRRSWSFDVASGPATVPIQILSHPNNGQVDGNGTHVRGRTAPFAFVDVKVNAVPPFVGQFGVAQQVFARRLQADANGNFDFDFSSPIPVPGTRYEVSMAASKADVTTEARLVLIQGQG